MSILFYKIATKVFFMNKIRTLTSPSIHHSPSKSITFMFNGTKERRLRVFADLDNNFFFFHFPLYKFNYYRVNVPLKFLLNAQHCGKGKKISKYIQNFRHKNVSHPVKAHTSLYYIWFTKLYTSRVDYRKFFLMLMK